jgi:MFS family permease
MLLSRTSTEAMAVALVLFVLAEFHSPPLAGLTVFVEMAPGLLMAPVMGALLDRKAPPSLIALDLCAAAATAALLSVLSLMRVLNPVLLLVIVGCGSLTNPLSFGGLRSALPMLLPSNRWDQANAIDGVTAEASLMLGPVLAGSLVGWANAQVALLALAVLWITAASALLGVKIPTPAATGRSVLSDARAGIVYLLHNPTLRGIGLSICVANLITGTVIVCLPLVVFQRFHDGAQVVGLLWMLAGVSGALSNVIIGRISTIGREPRLLICGLLMWAAGSLALALAHTVWLVAFAMIEIGVSNAVIFLPALAMRQRRTDPAVFGRIVATSTALYVSGIPIGSVLAGLVARSSTEFALTLGAVSGVVGALIAYRMIPTRVAEFMADRGANLR